MSDHQRLTAEELAAMRGRLSRATLGPWVYDEYGNVNGPDTGYGELRVATLQKCARHENLANGIFISTARTDMPRLLDEVDALIAAYNEQAEKIARYEALFEEIEAVDNDDYEDDYHEMKAIASSARQGG
ncbi:hypothetical protein [Tumebacillus flagellatus]|uniref:Uncharacterized protein n=1 Tax=Tumebacillus flagellatus TaxID=1157490 RepID=A0A074LW29_9BACL|nr:hypothetical protein [Tumebacillus flagellatus]KEO84785.1 hypothetical protein EL26_01885 [Tumebacillus flagellatus]